MNKRFATMLAGGLAGILFLAGCSGTTAEEEARNEVQATKAQGQTLEKKNLEEKRKREEDPNAIGYVYVMSFGKIIGYYVTKGKISSNGSQATPEDEVLWTCKTNHGCQPVVVDGPQDDGSYGDGDPGIFFFTEGGAKVVTNLDYIHMDAPLAIEVPLLKK